jgi:hypothetical protein
MKRKSTGLRHTASASATGKSKSGSNNSGPPFPYLAICVLNRGNEASLERGKAYRVIKPLASDPPGRIRVIDEEGEDYLYPAEWFVPIHVASSERQRVLHAVSA